MTNQFKSIIAIVVLIIVAIIGWLWYGSSHGTNTAMAPEQPVSMSTQDNNATPVAGLSTSATDTSDAALQSDLNSVDSQLNGLNSDTSNINQSLNQ